MSQTSRKPSEHEHRTVHVRRSRTGQGIFARRRFREDEMVGEIMGKLIRDDDYGSDYCFELEPGVQLEPISPFRFINHSCEPNCEFAWYSVENPRTGQTGPRLFLFAMHPIDRDEQLTIDYNWEAADAIRCRCGSAICRGWVVAAGELPKIESSLL